MKTKLGSKSIIGSLVALVVIMVVGLFILSDYMNEYPTHTHAWAEQDHHALAIGFINNDFNFFHPEAMIYNKQFPGWWKEAYDTTITSVDFPVHHYIVALMMRLFGTTSPWVFRLWTLLWGLIGLFFLFKITFALTGDWPKSTLVALVALTSPVFAYYLNGFLPSIPAFALGVIGLWFYLRFLDSEARKHFNLSIVFLTLAMLIRTTFAIELIAVLCFEVLRIFRKESTLKDKWPAVVFSFLAFGAYFLWNRHLRLQYGTLFLSELLPPDDLQDAKELLSDAYDNWAFQYFQKLQYRVFAILALLAIGMAVFQSIRKKEAHHKALSLWWLLSIYLFGCILFTIAMMQQIEHHDYYFIDTFFLPLLFLFALVLKAIPKPKGKLLTAAEYLIVGILAVPMVQQVTTSQMERRYWEQTALVSYNNYMDSDQFLDSLDISRDAKMLCLYGYAQNGPFIQMKRKGYIVMWDDEELLNNAFTWDFDYVVIENEKLRDHFDQRSTYFSQLKLVATNGQISVFTADGHPIPERTIPQ